MKYTLLTESSLESTIRAC